MQPKSKMWAWQPPADKVILVQNTTLSALGEKAKSPELSSKNSIRLTTPDG